MLDAPGLPLRAGEVPDPVPQPGQVLLAVRACGVCRTDLHVLDGELPDPKLPLVLGHQIVGVTEDGRRLGVPWLGWTDGDCRYCRSGRENLCDRARFTGYRLDGVYAELAVADERFCFPITDGYGDLQQGNLEQANVESVTEISDLIAAQRAYEMNAKVITAADQMLSATSNMMR